VMRRRAKRVREGQARERKKEGKPAYFGRLSYERVKLVSCNGVQCVRRRLST
jgi:hypothetical protein